MPDAIKQITQFELQRYLRDRMTWLAACAFAVLVLIGAVDYWNALPPRPDGSRLFNEAYFVLLCLAFHASIAQDRLSRFDGFLISNFVTSRVLYFGKVLSAALFLLGLAVVAFVVALVAALGDIGYAGHYTTLFLAGSVLLLPIVVLLEIGLPTRYPVPLILLLTLVVLAILQRTGDVSRFIRLLGLDGQLDVAAIVIRSALALAATAALFPVYRLRLRSRSP